MTEPEPSDASAIALELERLRRTVEVGFARVDGALALLVQRNDQSDQRHTALEERVDALEANRWPWPVLATLAAVAAVVVASWQLAAQ